MAENALVQSSNIQKFNISSNQQNKAADLTGGVVDFRYYESVLSNNVTASVVIVDSGFKAEGDRVNEGDLILSLKTISSTSKEVAPSPIKKEKPVKEIQVEELKKEEEIVTTPAKAASPKVRKFAREVGANIKNISGSQRAGRVTEEDIKKHIKDKLTSDTVKKETQKKYKDE